MRGRFSAGVSAGAGISVLIVFALVGAGVSVLNALFVFVVVALGGL